MNDDERIARLESEVRTLTENAATLEKKVAALEALVAMCGATMLEMEKLRSAGRTTSSDMPETVRREEAVMVVGAVLRPLMELVPSHERASILSEAPALVIAGAASAFCQNNPTAMKNFATAERYAEAHGLTWSDLGIAIVRDERTSAQRRFEELDAEVKQRMDAMRSAHDAQVDRVERALRTPR